MLNASHRHSSRVALSHDFGVEHAALEVAAGWRRCRRSGRRCGRARDQAAPDAGPQLEHRAVVGQARRARAACRRSAGATPARARRAPGRLERDVELPDRRARSRRWAGRKSRNSAARAIGLGLVGGDPVDHAGLAVVDGDCRPAPRARPARRWPREITRGDVIAMHVPRQLDRSGRCSAAMIVEPPNESPSTAVTYGIRRRRMPSVGGAPPTLAKPSEPRLSGIRAPPCSAK